MVMHARFNGGGKGARRRPHRPGDDEERCSTCHLFERDKPVCSLGTCWHPARLTRWSESWAAKHPKIPIAAGTMLPRIACADNERPCLLDGSGPPCLFQRPAVPAENAAHDLPAPPIVARSAFASRQCRRQHHLAYRRPLHASSKCRVLLNIRHRINAGASHVVLRRLGAFLMSAIEAAHINIVFVEWVHST